MHKSFKIYSLIWAICLFLFNIIIFFVPTSTYTLSFWTGYTFITLSFIGQLISAKFAFKADETKKMFYNMSLLIVSYIGFLLMLIVAIITMTLPSFSLWIGVILCMIILASMIIAIIIAYTTSHVAYAMDKKVKTMTFTIKDLTASASHLLDITESTEIKKEVKKVYEAFRFSDPMSNVSLIEINERIQNQFVAFKDSVLSEDQELTVATGKELLRLIDERNKTCKLRKANTY